jgi:hypothetical protein
MEIQEVRSEYFQENDTQQKHLSPASTKSSTFSSASPSAYEDELLGSFAQIKLKNMSAPVANGGATGGGSLILPSIKLFTAKRGNKKKKKKRITESFLDNGDNFSKQQGGGGGGDGEEEEEYKDDWSKQSCDEFFVPVESFLSTQLQREKSSKRRCKIVEKVRNVENNRKYVEDRLHEYDEKISLNTLLKQSKSCGIQVSATPMNLGQLNYRYYRLDI